MKNFKYMENIVRGKEVGVKPLATRSPIPIFNHPYNGHPDPLPLLLCPIKIEGILFCSDNV